MLVPDYLHQIAPCTDSADTVHAHGHDHPVCFLSTFGWICIQVLRSYIVAHRGVCCLYREVCMSPVQAAQINDLTPESHGSSALHLA